MEECAACLSAADAVPLQYKRMSRPLLNLCVCLSEEKKRKGGCAIVFFGSASVPAVFPVVFVVVSLCVGGFWISVGRTSTRMSEPPGYES